MFLAYELFLRAAERISRLNRWDTRTAIEMLENATELDPRFADAWARLAGVGRGEPPSLPRRNARKTETILGREKTHGAQPR
jgi:hypothetical protein